MHLARAKWAVQLSVCSKNLYENLRDSPGRRFADAAQDARAAGGGVFNTSFQFGLPHLKLHAQLFGKLSALLVMCQ